MSGGFAMSDPSNRVLLDFGIVPWSDRGKLHIAADATCSVSLCGYSKGSDAPGIRRRWQAAPEMICKRCLKAEERADHA